MMVVEETLMGLVSRTMDLALGIVLDEDKSIYLLKVFRRRNKRGLSGYTIELWLRREKDKYYLSTKGLDLLGYSNINIVYGLGERVTLEPLGNVDRESILTLLTTHRDDFLGLPGLVNKDGKEHLTYGAGLPIQAL